MNLYVKNHNFHFELENLTRLFFPNEKITVRKNVKKSADIVKYLLTLAEKEGFEPSRRY